MELMKELGKLVLAMGFWLAILVFVRTPVSKLVYGGGTPALPVNVVPQNCEQRARGVADHARQLSIDQQFSMDQADYERIYRNELAGCRP